MSKIEAVPDFPLNERETLAGWKKDGVEKKYLARNESSPKRFRFIDGPITANNPMGVHHAWGRTYKDFFQRYKNMQGFAQRFQNGFDCQGLWLEVEEEKSRGFNSKKDIENFGLANFSHACRARVEKYSAIQTEQSQRLGMFMDWGNSYYTMSETNNLYIWHFLKKCNEKGWLYKGVNSMPWCVRCGTAISAHELSDEGYKIVEHESVYVKFPLVSDDSKSTATSLLIWTTTPWTLLANVAVAVNPDYSYVKIRTESRPEELLIVAENRLSVIPDGYQVLEKIAGKDLVGKTYRGPFDELGAQKEVQHRVIDWPEVSETEGTGLVHIAPGAGEEDFILGKKFKLPVLAPLDEFGIYLPGYGEFTGKDARRINAEVFASLEAKKFLFKTEKIKHSYPHCWRCKEPLVFRVTEEWFIKVDPIRPLLKQLTEKIDWRPDYVGKRMQDWLLNMNDWPISRRRYWGLALPFYECPNNHLTVVGSKEELRQLAVEPEKVDHLPELHRPWIDEIKIKCPQCGTTVARVSYVGDCWLDAGIVSFSTLKYLEDKSYWEKWFPAEMVTEYVAQVKLWFYSLLFMAATLEERAPFEKVFTDGYVVDEKGEVMHKSKGNAIWFDEAVEKMGADIMRWVYMRADNAKDIRFGYGIGDEARRRFFLILWNSLKFVLDNREVDGVPVGKLSQGVGKSLPVLDRWILSRLNSTLKLVTEANDDYHPQPGALAIEGLVNDLSTWYIRRSRNRVGPAAENQEDKESFYQTANSVFSVLVRMLSPYTPFWVERIYKYLGGEKLSVHLEDWPVVEELRIDAELEKEMALVRQICEAGHAARKAAKIKVRQPLASLDVKVSTKGGSALGGQNSRLIISEDIKKLVLAELNVKQLKFTEEAGLKEMTVEYDLNITPELKAEGEARELIRSIQELRKEKGCRLTDKIVVSASAWPEAFEALIKRETLTAELKQSSDPLSITVL
ncbi:MAG: isoleucine--tRNA ligase [Patescibacteria group bacterium]